MLLSVANIKHLNIAYDKLTIEWKHFHLLFKEPFRIAHGVRYGTDSVFIKIKCRNVYGYGECTMPPYLNENKETAEEFLIRFSQVVSTFSTYDDIINHLHSFNNNSFIRAGLEMALLDLSARHEQKQVSELLGVGKFSSCKTTMTIAISDAASIAQRLDGLERFSLLKIKMGGADDIKMIEEIRKHTKADLCVDVNQGWKSVDEALNKINRLKDLGVLFVEQPLPVTMIKETKKLCAESSLPIYGDESIWTVSDIRMYKDCLSGINVKLMKTGGLLRALEMIEAAKENQMKVLVGCMSESSCGISAAAQISALCDYCDLDGPLLISNDPFTGVSYQDDKLTIKLKEGLGVETELFGE